MDATIIITCYNYEKYVEDAILSAINQNYDEKKYEVIVVDDGSNDSSGLIIDKYENDVRVYHLKNQGLEKSANFGISKSNGKYITRLDADDQLDFNYLETMCPFLSYNTELSFVYSDYYELYNNMMKRVKLPTFDFQEIISRGDFLATGTLIRKEAFDLTGGYKENIINSGLENYELILNMLLNQGMLGYHVKLPLFFYKIHGGNMSSLKKDRIIKYGENICKELGLDSYKINKYCPNKFLVNK